MARGEAPAGAVADDMDVATRELLLPQEVLESQGDKYNGVIITAEKLPIDVEVFQSLAKQSLRHWREQGKRGVWLKIPKKKSQLVHPAVQAGFEFHHAEKDYIMLTHWLPGVADNLPSNPSHQVGVGAFVLNERNEMLVVQERSGPLKGLKVWKMPTGLSNPGEDIGDTAVREVFEETGVRAEFQEVICFRQAHGFAFGKSDLFFVCAMRALATDITIQECEIEDCRWMPLDEFMAQKFWQNSPLHLHMMELCIANSKGLSPGLQPRALELGFRPGTQMLYAPSSSGTAAL
eukprot:jgi/Chlat1/2256/Chrsp17S02569